LTTSFLTIIGSTFENVYGYFPTLQLFQTISISNSQIEEVSFERCGTLMVSSSSLKYASPFNISCVGNLIHDTELIINSSASISYFELFNGKLELHNSSVQITNASLTDSNISLYSNSNLRFEDSIIVTSTNQSSVISLSQSTLDVANTPVCPNGLISLLCEGKHTLSARISWIIDFGHNPFHIGTSYIEGDVSGWTLPSDSNCITIDLPKTIMRSSPSTSGILCKELSFRFTLLESDASFTVQSLFDYQLPPTPSSALPSTVNATVCVSDCNVTKACSQVILDNATIASGTDLQPIYGAINTYCIAISSNSENPLNFTINLDFTSRQLDLSKTSLAFSKSIFVSSWFFSQHPLLSFSFYDQNGDQFAPTQPIILLGNCSNNICGSALNASGVITLPEMQYWSPITKITVYFSGSQSTTCTGFVTQHCATLEFLLTKTRYNFSSFFYQAPLGTLWHVLCSLCMCSSLEIPQISVLGEISVSTH